MYWRRVFLGLLLGGLALQPLHAQGPVRLLGDPVRDVQQTVQARRLLSSEADLQDLNLGVIVRDRVATLWGPAPSAEMAFRAELCLRRMIELAEIRNELFVTDLLEPVRRPLKGKRIEPDWARPPDSNAVRTILQMPVPFAQAEVTETKRTLLPDLPAIPLPALGSPQIEPDLSGARDRRLLEVVRTALQGSARFRAVLVAVNEGCVSLKMAQPDAIILQEAAQVVSYLPHVAAVLVEMRASPR